MASPDIPGRFPAWEPIDEAMDRLHERFVGHYDEPTSWDYSIWLGLTEAGRKVAKELRDAKDIGGEGKCGIADLSRRQTAVNLSVVRHSLARRKARLLAGRDWGR